MRTIVVAILLRACGPKPELPVSDWIPSEHASGADRWKDTTVYVDGRPVGVLAFPELPIALQPVWVDDVVSAQVLPGSHTSGKRHVRQRHYRMTEYLAAVGVDLARVRELHVVGPKTSETIVVGGDELRARGDGFLFRFGGDVSGKAIPVVPDDFGNGRTPDKIGAVMAYVDKEPPRVVRNRGLELDGRIVSGVPYFGEPLRGGVRVYLDDRLATVIKRKRLDGDGEGGPLRLRDFLEAQGVDLSGVVEAWIVRGTRRAERLSRRQLDAVTFEASPQARGQILVGAARLPANVLALHTRHLRRAELPRILPDEE